MKLLKLSTSILVAAVMFTGSFVNTHTTSADWKDILTGSSSSIPGSGVLGSFGTNSYTQSYDAESIIGRSTGDIKLSKRVRRLDYDQEYHETTVIRSGMLVEVWIEVKNTSGQAAQVVVTDTMGGGTIYKANTLLVNGQTSQPGLTSNGLRISVPAKGVVIITYQMYVCSGSTSAIRATAYSAGIGSATDAIIIQQEYSQTDGYTNQVSTCYVQFQNQSTPVTSGTTTYTTTSTNSNYSSYNPFSDWNGVNNDTSTNVAGNPFAGWSGVDNSASTNVAGNPFAGWSGVNNAASTNVAGNPFAGWSGVNNSASTTNPFGDWSGTNSNLGYSASGYSTGNASTPSTTVAQASTDYSSSRPNTAGYTPATATTVAPTNYVAPNTGVNKTAPIWFAGFLTAGFILFRKRKLIFN